MPFPLSQQQCLGARAVQDGLRAGCSPQRHRASRVGRCRRSRQGSEALPAQGTGLGAALEAPQLGAFLLPCLDSPAP